MKRKNKTIFKVTCDTEELNVLADKKDYRVSISQGTTGEEMTYALVALLQVSWRMKKPLIINSLLIHL